MECIDWWSLISHLLAFGWGGALMWVVMRNRQAMIDNKRIRDAVMTRMKVRREGMVIDWPVSSRQTTRLPVGAGRPRLPPNAASASVRPLTDRVDLMGGRDGAA